MEVIHEFVGDFTLFEKMLLLSEYKKNQFPFQERLYEA